MTDRGILLNAAGGVFRAEAFDAAERIHDIWPEVDITILQHPIDVKVKTPVQLYRIDGMMKTPYKRTLSIDTDVFMVEPVPELFDVLDFWDCALPMASIRNVYPIDVPECFYEFNPGVFAYRMSAGMRGFLQNWRERFLSHHDILDGKSQEREGWFHSQPSFTEAMYYSGLRVASLADEYNWRGTGYVQKRVKIVHKRPDPEGEAERINTTDDKPRVALLFEDVQVWE